MARKSWVVFITICKANWFREAIGQTIETYGADLSCVIVQIYLSLENLQGNF
jgi:hypothetical protein